MSTGQHREEVMRAKNVLKNELSVQEQNRILVEIQSRQPNNLISFITCTLIDQGDGKSVTCYRTYKKSFWRKLFMRIKHWFQHQAFEWRRQPYE